MANYELGNLVWRIRGDSTDFDRTLSGTENRAQRLSQKLKTVGTNLTKFVTLPLLGLGAAATKAASDLGESINAVGVVFGDAASVVNDFGAAASEAIGLSQTGFNELATVIGAQLKQAGGPIEEVADQTITLTRRAADLASVFNVDVKEATAALGAALRGESEPARRFGVNISDAAVQAEALASGLVNSKDEITEQIKVQARYNLILAQSQQVAGDFTNTSDSLANQTRILRADLENVAAELGEVLIPIVTDVVSGVRDVVGRFGDLDDGTKRLIVTVAGLAAAGGPILLAINAFNQLKSAIIAINTAALFGPAGIIAGLAAVAAGLAVVGARRREAALEEFAEDFGEVESAAGLATDQIRFLQQRVEQLARTGAPIERFEEILGKLAEETGVTKQAVIDIALRSERITGEYREQLEAIRARRQATQEAGAAEAEAGFGVAQTREQLEAIVRAEQERAAAAERAAVAAAAEAEAAAQEAERRRAINALAADARAEAEGRFTRLLAELDINTELERIEAERAQALSDLAAQYVRTGEAVDLLNEYYDELAERELARQAADDAAAAAEAARELAALRVELFGTEEERFEARLADQVARYREAGLTRVEIDRFVAERRQEFADQVAEAEARREEATEAAAAAEADRIAAEAEAAADAAREQAEAAERLAALRVELFGDETEQFEFELARRVEQYRETGLTEVEIARAVADQRLAFQEQLAAAAAETNDEIVADETETLDELLGLYSEYADKIIDIINGITDIRINNIETERDRKLAALDEEELGEEEYAEARKQIEQDAALEIWKVEKELFALRQAATVAQIAMDTAAAIMAAYAELGPIGGTVAAIVLGALGAVQAGVALSEPPPPRPAFALGGEFITNGPQTMLVGDNPGGRERVTVEPLGSGSGSRQPMRVMVVLDGRTIAESTVDYINNGVVRIEA